MMDNGAGLLLKYFVLSPAKQDPYGEASREAMIRYAECIKSTNPLLGRELEEWVESIEEAAEAKDKL